MSVKQFGKLSVSSRRFGDRASAFGFLRLLFASLVIVTHTQACADGDGHRELLMRIFGSITFGETAVDGFFIISGFLITASFLRSRSLLDYLSKRIARIYPGYTVAFIISVFVFAPIGGAVFSRLHELFYAATAIPLLRYPIVQGAFASQPFKLVNGAMWTIAYEFRCYLLVIVLSATGLLKRGWPIALMAATLSLLATLLPEAWDHIFDLHPMRESILGRPLDDARMTGMFLAGVAFNLSRHSIPLDVRWAIAAAALLCWCLCSHLTVNIGLALFGAYLIFYVAVLAAGTWVGKINNRTDISYGLYLYASPILNCGIRFTPNATPLWTIGLVTWVLACACGWLSWTLVERPAMTWARRQTSRPIGAVSGMAD